jgi:hypothetical protein
VSAILTALHPFDVPRLLQGETQALSHLILLKKGTLDDRCEGARSTTENACRLIDRMTCDRR